MTASSGATVSLEVLGDFTQNQPIQWKNLDIVNQKIPFTINGSLNRQSWNGLNRACPKQQKAVAWGNDFSVCSYLLKMSEPECRFS